MLRQVGEEGRDALENGLRVRVLEEQLPRLLALAHAAEDCDGGHADGGGREADGLGKPADQVLAKLHQTGVADAQDGVAHLLALQKVKKGIQSLTYLGFVIL